MLDGNIRLHWLLASVLLWGYQSKIRQCDQKGWHSIETVWCFRFLEYYWLCRMYCHNHPSPRESGGCFTKVSRAIQLIKDILSKVVHCWNACYDNFKLKLCTCPCFGHSTKFQLEILTIKVISGIGYFRDIILESSRNVSETTPRSTKVTQNRRTPVTQWKEFYNIMRCRWIGVQRRANI